MRRTGTPLTVVHVLPDPEKYPGPVENPYTALVVKNLDPATIRSEYFQWTRVFWTRFDIVHFHWPEYMTRHRRKSLAFVKCMLLWAFILRARLTRSAVVRTVHNVRPHEQGTRLESIVQAALDRATTLWIVLNPTTVTTDAGRTRLIPHGHYRDWYTMPSETAMSGQVLTFGMQRSYKGTGALISAFRELDSAEQWLKVCGKPATEQDKRDLEHLAAGASTVSIDLRFLDDDELTREIARSEVIVLPYQGIHNSGAALLALSLNRPIVVPRSASTELLSVEFGQNWVHLYDGPLTASSLAESLAHVRGADREDELDMSSRDWDHLARQLEDAYIEAAALVKSGHR
ncbi:hypothetical protein [Microbacterium sp. SLBN-146]|uniref:hypothetical protein n=1 Tax=Microbacterium sp. SLBN-146 TaxID=2768457 RepID=UPI001152B133|nr:hypothetical protein [Microbacterium sp. SLBN-146]TQJ29702.1 beta-1,4-mannosyltransferase [Microbacterium sp. SLBN-146]